MANSIYLTHSRKDYLNPAYLIRYVVLGPHLPYEIYHSEMIVTEQNKIILVGGYNYKNKIKVLGHMLQLDDLSSQWNFIELPLTKLRWKHLAFLANEYHKELLCGK